MEGVGMAQAWGGQASTVRVGPVMAWADPRLGHPEGRGRVL